MEIAVNRSNALVVDVTAVQVRIKGAIVKDVMKGTERAVTNAKVVKMANAFSKQIASPVVRERFMQGLGKSYDKWYLAFSSAIETVKAFESANEKLVQMTNSIKSGNQEFGGMLIDVEARNFRTSHDIAIPFVADYKEKVEKAFSDIIKELANAEAKDVNHGNLRNYAEIRVRYQATRDDIDRMKSEGVEFVWASSHANCSPRCEPWQGRLYSLYDRNGLLDGISYTALSYAMRGSENDGNGLLGYNCRHRLIPYFKGSTPPKDFTKEQIKKEYAIDQKQRSYEKRIRKAKETAVLLRGVDPKQAVKLSAKARELTKQYRAYSEENNRASYIFRTQIMREEN